MKKMATCQSTNLMMTQTLNPRIRAATPGRGQVPHPARKNDAAAVVHHHHLHQGQEAGPLAHAAGQGLVLRVPVLLPDLDQSLNHDPDQVLPNHQVQGKEEDPAQGQGLNLTEG